ncbi:MAG: hypothetical protein R3A45_01270 [Bdellovibrionota bacterium]
MWSLTPLVFAETMECNSKVDRQQEGHAYLYASPEVVEYDEDDVRLVHEDEKTSWGCPYFVTVLNDLRDDNDNVSLIYGGVSTETEPQQCGYTREYYGHGDTHLTVGDMEYLCPLVEISQ